MENNYYIRIQGEKFGFVVDGVHDILSDVDHAITNEDYNRSFELQSEGKQFRVKDVPTGEELFDLIEEYVPEVVETPYIVSLEERVEALEALMLEVI